MSKAAKHLADIAQHKVQDWASFVQVYCKKNQINLETLYSPKSKNQDLICLGGGGIDEATFKIFNAQGPSVLKLSRLPTKDSYVQLSEQVFRKNFPPQLLNILIPYKFDQEGDIQIVQRRFLPQSLASRIKFVHFLSFSVIFPTFRSYPPLLEIEKRWYIYQMVKGLQMLHSHAAYHSNLRLSNCLLTTWGWLYLSDASCFRKYELQVVCFSFLHISIGISLSSLFLSLFICYSTS